MDGGIDWSGDGRRAGFTIIELLIALSIYGIMVLVAMPRVHTILEHQRVNQAAVVVSQDLGRAVSAAATQRRPVRITLGSDQQSYVVTDAIGGGILWERALGAEEFRVTTVTFSDSPIAVSPTGFASQPLEVTVSAGGYSRTITMSTAGWVREND
jgi:prepilin-type N-terminal cleavage/methylation domain-containing protein